MWRRTYESTKQRARELKNRYGSDAWRPGDGDGLLRRLRQPNAPLKFEMGGDSRTLLIAFGGVRGGFGIPLFEFSSLTEDMPVKRLLVRDLHQAWYHRGLPQHGTTLMDVHDLLSEVIAAHGVDRLVMTGNSAGGYAALVFGALLGADTVLSFAPQTVLELDVLAAMDDHRWDDHLRPLIAWGSLDQRWTDLQRALPQARRADTRYEIYFGVSQQEDRLHAERLGGLEGVRLYRMGEAKHYVVRKMRNSGALERVLRRALAEPQQTQGSS